MNDATHIDKSTGRRIMKAVRDNERTPKTTVATPRSPVPPGGGLVMKLTQALQPGDNSTQAGVGQGSLMAFDPSTGRLSVLDSTTYPVFNLTKATIKQGSLINVYAAYGVFWYLTTDCSNGA